MRKNTEELLNQIETSRDLFDLLTSNSDEIIDCTASDYIMQLLAQKHLRVSDVAIKSGHGDYVYKVFQGTRKASRDILLAIAFGMQLSVEETQNLLRLAQTARLDPRQRRDVVVLYALHKMLSVNDVNSVLYELDENLI